MGCYCSFELFFAEVVDPDLELDVAAVEKEAFVVECHGDALVVNWDVERHFVLYVYKY